MCDGNIWSPESQNEHGDTAGQQCTAMTYDIWYIFSIFKEVQLCVWFLNHEIIAFYIYCNFMFLQLRRFSQFYKKKSFVCPPNITPLVYTSSVDWLVGLVELLHSQSFKGPSSIKKVKMHIWVNAITLKFNDKSFQNNINFVFAIFSLSSNYAKDCEENDNLI